MMGKMTCLFGFLVRLIYKIYRDEGEVFVFTILILHCDYKRFRVVLVNFGCSEKVH